MPLSLTHAQPSSAFVLADAQRTRTAGRQPAARCAARPTAVYLPCSASSLGLLLSTKFRDHFRTIARRHVRSAMRRPPCPGVRISQWTFAHPLRPALETAAIRFANFPIGVERQNAQTRHSLKIAVMRDQRHVEPKGRRGGRRPAMRSPARPACTDRGDRRKGFGGCEALTQASVAIQAPACRDWVAGERAGGVRARQAATGARAALQAAKQDSQAMSVSGVLVRRSSGGPVRPDFREAS